MRGWVAVAVAVATLLACSSAPAGDVTTLAGGPVEGFADGMGASAQFGPPGDIAVSSGGVLYVSDVFNSAIRRIAPSGETTTIAGGERGSADGMGAAAQFNAPFGLALDGEGILYVADSDNGTIRRIDLATSEVTTVTGQPGERGHVDGALEEALLDRPSDVDLEPGTSRLWIVDGGNDAIRIADLSAGTVSTIAGGSGGISDGVGSEAQFNGPSSVACDGSGGAWVSDRNSNTIRHVAGDGTVTTVLGAPLRSGFRDGEDALLNHPTGLVRTEAGVVFADQQNNVLRLFDPAGGTRLLAGSPYDSGALEPSTHPDSEDGSAGEAVLRSPRGVAVDNVGTIHFTGLYGVRALRGW